MLQPLGTILISHLPRSKTGIKSNFWSILGFVLNPHSPPPKKHLKVIVTTSCGCFKIGGEEAALAMATDHELQTFWPSPRS